MSQEFSPFFYSSAASMGKDAACSRCKDDENIGESLAKRNLTYLSVTMQAIIHAVMGELLHRIIDQDLKENCNGCAIDHRANSNTHAYSTPKNTIYI